MGGVSWVKVSTGLFDNRKIKQIRALPDGDSIIVLWLQILTLAGTVNEGGALYITNGMPYSVETLATEFGMDYVTLHEEIVTLQRYNMVTLDDGVISVSNWDKYQSVEGLDKIREQTRRRVAKHRAKQAENADCNADVTLQVTQCNATDKELDKELDKDIKESVRKSAARPKFKPPTAEDVKEYAANHGYSIDADKFVDYYTSSGWMVGRNKMKDWKAAVRNWHRREDQTRQKAQPVKNRFNNFPQREYNFAELEKQLLGATK